MMDPISYDSSAKWWQERFWWWWTTSQNELTGKQHGGIVFLFAFGPVGESLVHWVVAEMNEVGLKQNYQTNYQTSCLEIPPNITRTIKLCLESLILEVIVFVSPDLVLSFQVFKSKETRRGVHVAPVAGILRVVSWRPKRKLKLRRWALWSAFGPTFGGRKTGPTFGPVLAGLFWDPCFFWMRFLRAKSTKPVRSVFFFGVTLTGEAETRKWTQRKGEKEETQRKVQRRRTTSAPIQGAAFRSDLCKFPCWVE